MTKLKIFKATLLVAICMVFSACPGYWNDDDVIKGIYHDSNYKAVTIVNQTDQLLHVALSSVEPGKHLTVRYVFEFADPMAMLIPVKPGESVEGRYFSPKPYAQPDNDQLIDMLLFTDSTLRSHSYDEIIAGDIHDAFVTLTAEEIQSNNYSIILTPEML